VRELKLAPEAFWKSTLRELLPLHAGGPAAAELRARLAAMAQRWPDMRITKHD